MREQHGSDESYHPVARRPTSSSYPHDTEEVAAIVASAPRHGVPIIPFGAGTSLEGHVAALHGGVSVDLREMNACCESTSRTSTPRSRPA